MQESSTRQHRSRSRSFAPVVVLVVVVLFGASAAADSPAPFGAPMPGLTEVEQNRFEAGLDEFSEAEEADEGLGPVFNQTSCAACHSGPAVGGDSNVVETRFGRIVNGQFDPMESAGGSLIQTDGVDPAHGCRGERVPREATIVAQRKTTPLFGLGLVDHVPDGVFMLLAAQQRLRNPEQAGRPSIVQDAATGRRRIGRFGWKAQVATLVTFSADAYLNEMGITSPIFPKDNAPGGSARKLDQCDQVADVEDDGSGVAAFTDFMTMLAPPPRGPISPAVQRGEVVFQQIGCAVCHTPKLLTGPSPIRALSRVTFEPFSDYLLHDMGSLGDGIVQGTAGGRQMKTAALWGLRMRTRYLHDARATTLEQAIRAHDGQGAAARDAFRALGRTETSDLLAFLRSL
jgi:CxxC motif-containing protein (DUF1111 family)